MRLRLLIPISIIIAVISSGVLIAILALLDGGANWKRHLFVTLGFFVLTFIFSIISIRRSLREG